MRCRDEFGPEFAVPFDLLNYLLANGWEDTSWHNDVCPSFLNSGKHLLLWADAENRADREFRENLRFHLYTCDEDGFALEEESALVSTESLTVLLTFLRDQTR